MQKTIFAASAAFLFICLVSKCTNATEAKPMSGAISSGTTSVTKEDPVKRGEYLVSVMGCDDCHSPKKMGVQGPEVIQELRLSGHPGNSKLPPLDANATKTGWISFGPDFTTTVGPWGQSYAANITSDTTGIGTWTEGQFKKAVLEGKFKGLEGTRPILPPMPWQNFHNLKDDDLSAIFAFLKSTKPIKNVVSPAKLNPPPKM